MTSHSTTQPSTCRHLPDDVRVFSAQRVNNRFNGRDMCTTRTYHFYVPAAALKLRCDGGAADQDALQRLQRTLDVFVAERPYHNYTQRCVFRTCSSAACTLSRLLEPPVNLCMAGEAHVATSLQLTPQAWSSSGRQSHHAQQIHVPHSDLGAEFGYPTHRAKYSPGKHIPQNRNVRRQAAQAKKRKREAAASAADSASQEDEGAASQGDQTGASDSAAVLRALLDTAESLGAARPTDTDAAVLDIDKSEGNAAEHTPAARLDDANNPNGAGGKTGTPPAADRSPAGVAEPAENNSQSNGGGAASAAAIAAAAKVRAAAQEAVSTPEGQQLQERFGRHWRPFVAYHLWSAPTGERDTSVFQAHWRRIHR